MEFPELGKNCSESTCNRLDFLPMQCDSCDRIFCSSHFNYERHSCVGAHRKDWQVPVCPMCSEPVPTPRGVEPDVTVGQHIDQQCRSETKKIFTNRCTYKGCKRKELIPVTCSQCKQNFCLRHRHTADHNCSTNAASASSSSAAGASGHPNVRMNEAEQRAMTANAAEYRRSHKPTTLFNANTKPSRAAAAAQRSVTSSHVQSVQGDMTEDEALARALALSIMELDESADRNRRNEAAAQQTVPVGGRDGQQTGGGGGKDKCSLS